MNLLTKVTLAYHSSVADNIPITYALVSLKSANDGGQWQHAQRYLKRRTVTDIIGVPF